MKQFALILMLFLCTIPSVQAETVVLQPHRSKPAVDTVVEGGAGQPTVLVEWMKKWYLARVLKQEGAKSYIHYIGYGSHWDEWATPDRIVHLQVHLGEMQYKVHVSWGERWWPAVILERKDERFLIRYLGYCKCWDEWVTKERIRL